jgi:hypothetical protein
VLAVERGAPRRFRLGDGHEVLGVHRRRRGGGLRRHLLKSSIGHERLDRRGLFQLSGPVSIDVAPERIGDLKNVGWPVRH